MTLIEDRPPVEPVEATVPPHTAADTRRAFLSVLGRDVFVTGRELPSFLAQVVLQPLFTLFILGTVLGSLGYVTGDFGLILLPGVIALAGFVGALQNTALPLTLDFSYTREIEDRLLAPLPMHWVAVEKMVFGAFRGLLSALLMIPFGYLLLDDVHLPLATLPAVLGVCVLGTLLGAAVGMTLGTFVPPHRIEIMFAVILTPVMFTGATQFPWPALDSLLWFQIVSALNPLTYFSEALRGLTLDGAVPAMPLWVSLSVLVLTLAAFGAAGVRGFRNRAAD
ncbi:ABC-2 type transport system permease protein [Prauserella aidingensis]|uniref:ABC transporter permease n=1 Tax=Prauserella aidingensis TaxID=387890 RepID=UPI0020A26445|nr:ABC transporter permease [Prauserella aidingensis]MCP2253994.1 ABC-2 type transport system permease protein [Prauserella aidingensis]